MKPKHLFANIPGASPNGPRNLLSMKTKMLNMYNALKKMSKTDATTAKSNKIDYQEYLETVFYASSDYEDLVTKLKPLQVLIIRQISPQILRLIGQGLFEILDDGVESEKKIYVLKFYIELLQNAHRVKISTIFTLEEMVLFKFMDNVLVCKDTELQVQELLLLHQLLPPINQDMAKNFFPGERNLQKALIAFNKSDFRDGVQVFSDSLRESLEKDKTYTLETISIKIGRQLISVLGNDDEANNQRHYVDFNCTKKTVSFRRCIGKTQTTFAVVKKNNIADISIKEFVRIGATEIGIKLRKPLLLENMKGKVVRFRFCAQYVREFTKHQDNFLKLFFGNIKVDFGTVNKEILRSKPSDRSTPISFPSIAFLKSPSLPESSELNLTDIDSDMQETVSYKYSSELIYSQSKSENIDSFFLNNDLDFSSFEDNLSSNVVSTPVIGESQPLPDLLISSVQVETGVPDSDQFYTPILESNTEEFQANCNSMEFAKISVGKSASLKCELKQVEDLISEDVSPVLLKTDVPNSDTFYTPILFELDRDPFQSNGNRTDIAETLQKSHSENNVGTTEVHVDKIISEQASPKVTILSDIRINKTLHQDSNHSEETIFLLSTQKLTSTDEINVHSLKGNNKTKSFPEQVCAKESKHIVNYETCGDGESESSAVSNQTKLSGLIILPKKKNINVTAPDIRKKTAECERELTQENKDTYSEISDKNKEFSSKSIDSKASKLRQISFNASEAIVNHENSGITAQDSSAELNKLALSIFKPKGKKMKVVLTGKHVKGLPSKVKSAKAVCVSTKKVDSNVSLDDEDVEFKRYSSKGTDCSKVTKQRKSNRIRADDGNSVLSLHESPTYSDKLFVSNSKDALPIKTSSAEENAKSTEELDHAILSNSNTSNRNTETSLLDNKQNNKAIKRKQVELPKLSDVDSPIKVQKTENIVDKQSGSMLRNTTSLPCCNASVKGQPCVNIQSGVKINKVHKNLDQTEETNHSTELFNSNDFREFARNKKDTKMQTSATESEVSKIPQKLSEAIEELSDNEPLSKKRMKMNKDACSSLHKLSNRNTKKKTVETSKKKDVRKEMRRLRKLCTPRKRWGFLGIDPEEIRALPKDLQENFVHSMSSIHEIVNNLKMEIFKFQLSLNKQSH